MTKKPRLLIIIDSNLLDQWHGLKKIVFNCELNYHSRVLKSRL